MYICIGLGISYVSIELGYVSLHSCMAYYNTTIHAAETYSKIRVCKFHSKKSIPPIVVNGLYTGYPTIANLLKLFLQSSLLWLVRYGVISR